MKWNSKILNLKAYQPGKSIEEVKAAFHLDEIHN